MTWFRFYEEALDDPKVQRLPAEVFKGWVNLLCLSKRHDGQLPALEDTAFALRMSEKETWELIETLTKHGLLDAVGNGHEPHNWNGRQYKSDVSTERVKRFRKRQRNAEGNDDETGEETPPETETEQRQNRAERAEEPEPPKAPRKRAASTQGKRLPEDWKPNPDLLTWAMNERKDLDMQRVIDSFTDHWRAATGQKATKRDWDATFRNWVRNERSHKANGTGRTHQGAVRETAADRRDRLAREELEVGEFGRG